MTERRAAAATGHSVATVSHHLGKVTLTGLVAARRDGKRQVCVADDPHVIEVVRLPLGAGLTTTSHDRADARAAPDRDGNLTAATGLKS